jgi:hypothetical protein
METKKFKEDAKTEKNAKPKVEQKETKKTK